MIRKALRKSYEILNLSVEITFEICRLYCCNMKLFKKYEAKENLK